MLMNFVLGRQESDCLMASETGSPTDDLGPECSSKPQKWRHIPRKSYLKEEKLQVIEFYHASGGSLCKTRRKFAQAAKTVLRWVRNEDKIRRSREGSKRVRYRSRAAKTREGRSERVEVPEVEDEMLRKLEDEILGREDNDKMPRREDGDELPRREDKDGTPEIPRREDKNETSEMPGRKGKDGTPEMPRREDKDEMLEMPRTENKDGTPEMSRREDKDEMPRRENKDGTPEMPGREDKDQIPRREDNDEVPRREDKDELPGRKEFSLNRITVLRWWREEEKIRRSREGSMHVNFSRHRIPKGEEEVLDGISHGKDGIRMPEGEEVVEVESNGGEDGQIAEEMADQSTPDITTLDSNPQKNSTQSSDSALGSKENLLLTENATPQQQTAQALRGEREEREDEVPTAGQQQEQKRSSGSGHALLEDMELGEQTFPGQQESLSPERGTIRQEEVQLKMVEQIDDAAPLLTSSDREKKRKSYPREAKLKVVEFFKANGRNLSLTCKTFSQCTKTVLRWVRNEEKIRNSKEGCRHVRFKKCQKIDDHESKRKSYSREAKLKVVEFYKANGRNLCLTRKNFALCNKNVLRWVKDEEKIRNSKEGCRHVRFKQHQNCSEMEQHQNISEMEQHQNFPEMEQHQNSPEMEQHQNLEQHQNISEMEQHHNSPEMEQHQNLPEMEQHQNLEQHQNCSEMEQHQNFSEMEQHQNLPEMEQHQNLPEMEQHQNLPEMEQHQNLPEMEQHQNLSEMEQHQNLSEMEQHQNLSEMEQHQNLPEMEQHQNLSEMEQHQNLPEMEQHQNLSEMEQHQNFPEMEQRLYAEYKELQDNGMRMRRSWFFQRAQEILRQLDPEADINLTYSWLDSFIASYCIRCPQNKQTGISVSQESNDSRTVSFNQHQQALQVRECLNQNLYRVPFLVYVSAPSDL